MSMRSDVLRAIREGKRVSATEIREAVGRPSQQALRSVLTELVNQGVVHESRKNNARAFELAGPDVRDGTNPFEWRTYQRWSPS